MRVTEVNPQEPLGTGWLSRENGRPVINIVKDAPQEQGLTLIHGAVHEMQAGKGRVYKEATGEEAATYWAKQTADVIPEPKLKALEQAAQRSYQRKLTKTKLVGEKTVAELPKGRSSIPKASGIPPGSNRRVSVRM